MTVQDLAAALIRTFEGCRLTPYQDGGGLWTIGFGHRMTPSDIKALYAISYQTATEMLATDAEPLFELVKDKPIIAAAAYISFGYNCGKASLALVLQGKARMLDFVHDHHGNIEPGLLSRRTTEAALIEAATSK